MKSLTISNRLFSESVWQRMFETSAIRLEEKRASFFKSMASLENLRETADYDTGSITSASAWALYCTAYYFQPLTTLEIGTFIGRSTLSIAMGMDDAGISGGTIHTCDLSNDIKLPEATKTKITQYPKQSSTDMLKTLIATLGQTNKFEMIHIDGRLQDQDCKFLDKIRSPEMIIALDDYESLEKGVANHMNLKDAGILEHYQFVYPTSEALLQKFGFKDHSTTALLLPEFLIQHTSQ